MINVASLYPNIDRHSVFLGSSTNDKKEQAVTLKSSPKIVIVLALVVLCTIVLPVEGADPISVTYITGNAFIGFHSKGPWLPITQRTIVTEGQFIKTGRKGIVALLMPDKSRIRLAPNTLFRIDEASFPKQKPRTFSAKLFLGRLWANVTRRAGISRDRFQTRTPTIVAGVRGTIYDLKAAADTSTTVLVYAGNVGVSPPRLIEGGPKEEMTWPDEVSEQKWKEIILGRLQKLRIGPDGRPGKPVSFDPQIEKDEWSEWNQKRDALQTD